MTKEEVLDLLQKEIDEAKRRVKTDSLSMSIGEIVNKIENSEIILRPKFQRFFRWTDVQKSNLIESILMMLPIPPIFVSTNNEGKWEVIDGLQRLNTIYSFYKNHFSLEECRYIKSFKGLKYENFAEKFKLMFRNKRFDFIILDETSDVNAKYDMFNRLNTGGSALSYQEVRNCIMIMQNESFFDWFYQLRECENFKHIVTDVFSSRNVEEQKDLEMILKFLAIRNCNGKELDFHFSKEFLDEQAFTMAQNSTYDREENEKAFRETFKLLDQVLGVDAFKKYDPVKEKFTGPLNFSIYEFLISGIGKNILFWDASIKKIVSQELKDILIDVYKKQDFEQISKVGTTVSVRLKNAIKYADKVFGKNGIIIKQR